MRVLEVAVSALKRSLNDPDMDAKKIRTGGTFLSVVFKKLVYNQISDP